VNALSILLPFASTFVGAAITYLINVRQRRLSYEENLLNAAIEAVAAAEISVDFLASAGRSSHMTDQDFAEFQSWLVIDGMKAWATKVARANEALARVLPYKPELERLLPFQPDASHRGAHMAIITVLRATGGPPPDVHRPDAVRDDAVRSGTTHQ
jgi:hypothetical protein